MTQGSIKQDVRDPLGLHLNLEKYISKISRIGPEMAKLRSIYQWEVALFQGKMRLPVLALPVLCFPVVKCRSGYLPALFLPAEDCLLRFAGE